jgi:hypothetical protein
MKRAKKANRFFRISTLICLAAAVSLSTTACGSINTGGENANTGAANQTRAAAAGSGNPELAAAVNSISGSSANNLPGNPVKAAASPTPKKPAANAVCPDPQKPCKTKDKEFAEWELSFRLPAKIKPNTNYRSAPFYAVILKKYEEGCSELDENPAVEPERVQIQKQYPARKVFAEYSCPNMDATGYDFAGKTNKQNESLYMDYIAVYAGETPEEADRLLGEVKAEFPNALIKRMTANWSLIEQ